MIKKLLTLAALAAICSQAYCQEKLAGGDISLLSRYEENGALYYDHNGSAITDMLGYFKQEGWNAMRLRLFVDPSNASETIKGEGVCQDIEYVKSLGKRIKDAGFKLMVDFHYSDTWADPVKQWTPNSWKDLNDTQLYSKVYEYTKDALTQLAAAGATPDLIQTGNEISYGMLWGTENGTTLKKCYPTTTDNWDRFTTILKNASKACREVCPDASIILHIERVAQPNVITNFYNRMNEASVDYDIIGLSYYPYYHGNLNTLEQALTTTESNFIDKNIMIVETGYPYKWAAAGTTYDYSGTYPYSDEGQKKLTDDLINMLNKHANVNGLFWWWPEANEYGLDWATERVTDSWNNSSLFDNQTGKATSALSSLKNFANSQTNSIEGIKTNKTANSRTFNINGQVINNKDINGLPKGIYIKDGKKFIR